MRKSANPDTTGQPRVDVAGAGAQSLGNPGAFVRMSPCIALYRPLDACKGKRKGGGGKRK
jgi:hypothetical protein